MANVVVDIIGRDKFSGVANKAIGSITEFSSAIGLLEKGLGYAQKAFDATAGATIDYANTVRDLSLSSGESAENTSRFIQVLDDYRLSADDAKTATKALTKQGLAPNIQTLAKLSDEYLKINDVEERNAFVIKNLGRAGLEWNRILKAGSGALLEQADAVSDGLILNKEQLDAAEELRLAQDDLNDSTQALAITIGNKLIPVVNDAVRIINANLEATMKMPGVIARAIDALNGEGTAADKSAAAIRLVADAAAEIVNSNLPSFLQEERAGLDTATEGYILMAEAQEKARPSAEDLEQAQKDLAAAIKDTTEANNGLLGLTMNLQNENNNYNKSLEGLMTKQGELKSNINTLISQGWSPLSDKVQDLQKEYDETGVKITELEADHAMAMKKIAYNLFITKLQADGFTDAEFRMALEAGVAAGIIDQKTADMAMAMDTTAERAANAADKIGDIKTGIDNLPSNKTIDIILNAIGVIAEAGERRERAIGGQAAGLTLVGERGPELVDMPGGSHVYPNSQSMQMLGRAGAGGVNVSINVAGGGVIADPQEFARQIKPALRYALREMGVM